MANTQLFISYIEQFSYLGMFVFIALSGYIIPIPEEILLLLTGYLADLGYLNIYIAGCVAILGVLAGDNILFWLSRLEGSRIVDKLKHKIRKRELQKYRNLMKRNMGKTIFILRFVVGLRFFSPLIAGSMKVRWKTFQLYNLLAVLIYTPIFIFLGYYFHNQLSLIITRVEIARHLLFFFVLVFAGFFISFFIQRKYAAENSK